MQLDNMITSYDQPSCAFILTGVKGDQGFMGVPGFIGVKGERGPSGPKGDTGPPGKSCTFTEYTDCSLVTRYVHLCFLSWSLHDPSLLQVSVGYQATRVLLQYPSRFQERGALQDRRVSKDQRGSKGDQGHRAPLGMQVSYSDETFVVEHP